MSWIFISTTCGKLRRAKPAIAIQAAALVVEDFKEEEAGVYRCRVDFRTAQTRNTFINVSLIGEGQARL